VPLRRRLGVAGPFGLGLRLSAAGVAEIERDDDLRERIGARFAEHDLVPFTGNAFVLGEFHGRAVKDDVYRPPWSEPERGAYTRSFARLLASWNAPGSEVSLSSAPGSWRLWREGADAEGVRAREIATCARALERISRETGVHVRLGLEPEPGCTLDTTEDACAFFAGPLAYALDRAGGGADHVGLCFDVCHQAVMHEDVAAALLRIDQRGIRLAKVQASCALEAPDLRQPRVRAALAAFAEPVYLHQTVARDRAGRAHLRPDLPDALADAGLAEIGPWRVHFHVPVYRDPAPDPLSTTRPDLEAAYEWVLGEAQKAGFRPDPEGPR
jgi:hypothetical protein